MEYSLRVRTGETETIISVHAGETLACALTRGGFDLAAPCGGRGTCGKCRVFAAGELSSRTAREQALLPNADAGERLACQTLIAGDCRVRLHASDATLTADLTPDALFPTRPLFQNRFAAREACGAAIDIGTTTLEMRLYDHGGFLRGCAGRSMQRAFGADVITRIDAALNGSGALLRDAVLRQLDNMLSALLRDACRSRDDLTALVITGNTSMLYLLTGRDPSSLARAPFIADHLFGETVSARTLGLELDARVYLPRCMHAFIGADISCAALYAGIAKAESEKSNAFWAKRNSLRIPPQDMHAKKAILLADVGTNSEMLLWKDGVSYVCSAAAGPAFEGALLSCGSLGVDGAIEHVRVENGFLSCDVIGGGSAKSICGSGAADALSALYTLGHIDETGRIVPSDANEAGALIIAGDVILTQADIRALQLAKAAICAGIETLLAETGTAASDVSRFFIAGGFGAHLSLDTAAHIGVFPQELASRAEVLGNAALLGASELLLNANAISALEAFAKRAVHIPLAGNAGFMERYVSDMGLMKQSK